MLGTVLADASLEQVVEAACAGFLGHNTPVTALNDYVQVDDATHDERAACAAMPITIRLAQSMGQGLALWAIRLVPRVAPIPWEDDTEDVLDLTDEVPATDEQYMTRIEGYWEEHQRNRLMSDKEKADYALYLKLKAQFGQ